MSVAHIPVTVEKDRAKRRLDAYGSVFQKTDRIISGERLEVVVLGKEDLNHKLEQIGGWTDGETITLNGGLLLDKLKETDKPERVMAYFKGVNYHELAHVLFTPRMGSNLTKTVLNERDVKGQLVWTAFNALEDQRAEMLFVSKFRSSRHYFQAIALEYLLNDPSFIKEQYPLIHGRVWIPERTRTRLAEMYDESVGVDGRSQEFGAIIDEYQKLVFPSDDTRGFELIMAYYDLLLDSSASHGYSSGHDVVPIRKGRPAPKGEQEAASEGVDDVINEIAEEQSEGDGGGDEDGEDEGDDAGADISGSGDEGEGDGAGSDDGDDDDDSDSSGHSPSYEDAIDALEDIADDLDDLWENEDFIEDVRESTKAVQGEQKATKPGTLSSGDHEHKLFAATSSDHVAKMKIIRELQHLRMNLQGFWDRQKPTGKVNVYDYMTRTDDDFNVFNRWVESVEEQGGLDVIILVDASGSMGYGSQDANSHIGKALRSAWILKLALEESDSRVTVMTFNTGPYRVLYAPTDLASRYEYRWVSATGGTDPTEAIRESARLMDTSDKPNKLVVLVTDGQLSDPSKTREVMEWLNTQNIITSVVGINGAVKGYGTHGALVGIDIDDPMKLPEFVQSLVRVMLQRLVQSR